MSQRRIAIISGAGSGVGAACAKELAARGADCVLIGRNREKLAITAAGLPLQQGAEALICAGDITDSTFSENVLSMVLEQFGRRPIDLVNSAGVIARRAAESTTDEEWRRVMATNVDGVFYLSRAVAKVAPSGSSMVNVSSTCGQVGAAGLAAYCASKGAVDQLTRTMAVELASRDITVNAVAPGAINSPMLFSEHDDPSMETSVIARNEASIPMGRVAEPEEVAAAIVFLSTQRHITGTVLSVDGGYVAQ